VPPTRAVLTSLAVLAVAAVVGAYLIAPTLAGPGASPPPTDPPVTATPQPDPLPPEAYEDLAAIFDPLLAPMDLRLTRASLPTLGPGPDTPGGPHLALYVEPTADYSAARYTSNLVELSELTVPYAFARWSGLVSIDVCQEPPPEADDPPEPPPPETVIFITREVSDSIDWATLDLPGLAEAFLDDRLHVGVSPRLALEPSWAAALRAAGGAPEG
jgi:hypothetical protein